MKADGIEYDERMELLEDVTWPKPLEELLTALFTTYRQTHPWVSPDALSPKSVVRDMWERAMTFSEYVAYYGLSARRGPRAALPVGRLQGPAADRPESARTEALTDLTEWLGAVVRQTDSSLLDEWEALVDPDRAGAGMPGAGPRRPRAGHATPGPSGC